MSRTGNAGENEWGSGVDDGGRTGRGFGRIVAAGFVAVVIVAAVALFIAGRFGGDDSTDASGDGAAGGAGGAVSSGQVAERFEWADRKADVNGQMVYKPEHTGHQTYFLIPVRKRRVLFLPRPRRISCRSLKQCRKSGSSI